MKTVYKIVAKCKRKLMSGYTSIWNRGSKYSLHYRVGKRVKAVEGSLGIFAFDTLEAAKRYVWDTRGMRIYEATCPDCRVLHEFVAYGNDIENYYNGDDVIKQKPPKGTVVCGSIVLKKKVWDGDK